MKYNVKEFTKPDENQKKVILRRQMDPANYLVIKSTRTDLYLWDIRTRKVRHIVKHR